ncbi:MAG: DUF4019 domain-containing protein [Candidatus Omnitrophica bacterium]|nr:DUF4019 domain-containing protein [Candidatus Omnitrophota bacterium]
MRNFWGLMVAAMVLTCGVGYAAMEDKTAAALDAAQQWLAVCDQGDYGQSWETAAVYFKGAVQKEQWEQMLVAVRAPLGPVRKREVMGRDYRTALPGAPDGEYVVMQFAVSFEKKNESVETVTMMFEQDRGWRVAGYFVR